MLVLAKQRLFQCQKKNILLSYAFIFFCFNFFLQISFILIITLIFLTTFINFLINKQFHQNFLYLVKQNNNLITRLEKTFIKLAKSQKNFNMSNKQFIKLVIYNLDMFFFYGISYKEIKQSKNHIFFVKNKFLKVDLEKKNFAYQKPNI